MKASSKRILSILFSAVFLLGTLVIYGNLIQPEINTASGLQSIVASKTNLLNSQKTAVAQVSQLISQFQNAAALQKTVTLAMPLGPDTTDILNQWQAIAQASGVALQSLNVQPIGASGPAATSTLVKKVASVAISFSAIGSYTSLKQFLQSIETNVRVTNVNTFELNALQGSGQGGTASVYTLQSNVSSFYQNSQ
jgi:Tfp pilus assembly protein PilO